LGVHDAPDFLTIDGNFPGRFDSQTDFATVDVDHGDGDGAGDDDLLTELP
jgi:hypothetical protein